MEKSPRQIYIITTCLDVNALSDEKDNRNHTEICRLGAAFAQAMHAISMGRLVTIFLEAAGANWASPTYLKSIKPFRTNCFHPVEYFNQCLEAEAEILICSSCLNCLHNIEELGQDLTLGKPLYSNIVISTFTRLQKYFDEPCNIFTF